jgi:hypothetical protein
MFLVVLLSYQNHIWLCEFPSLYSLAYTKYGPMVTELHPLLVQPLIEYVGEGRPALLLAAQHSTPAVAAASLNTHRYVFVNRSGRPFSAPSWTQLVQGVFERETGRRIGNNLLRDSFVTHVYAGDVSVLRWRNGLNLNHSDPFLPPPLLVLLFRGGLQLGKRATVPRRRLRWTGLVAATKMTRKSSRSSRTRVHHCSTRTATAIKSGCALAFPLLLGSQVRRPLPHLRSLG